MALFYPWPFSPFFKALLSEHDHSGLDHLKAEIRKKLVHRTFNLVFEYRNFDSIKNAYSWKASNCGFHQVRSKSRKSDGISNSHLALLDISVCHRIHLQTTEKNFESENTAKYAIYDIAIAYLE
ncbi:hypothetical protein PV326_003781 [Microctonus aethiopoides]|nr:hypothetical protein PV326_003781 [Microctonus aethiopoides]